MSGNIPREPVLKTDKSVEEVDRDFRILKDAMVRAGLRTTVDVNVPAYVSKALENAGMVSFTLSRADQAALIKPHKSDDMVPKKTRLDVLVDAAKAFEETNHALANATKSLMLLARGSSAASGSGAGAGILDSGMIYTAKLSLKGPETIDLTGEADEAVPRAASPGPAPPRRVRRRAAVQVVDLTAEVVDLSTIDD